MSAGLSGGIREKDDRGRDDPGNEGKEKVEGRMILPGRNEPGCEHNSVRQDIDREVVMEIEEHPQEEADRDRAAQMSEKDVGVDFFLKPQAQFAIPVFHGWIPFLVLFRNPLYAAQFSVPERTPALPKWRRCLLTS